MSAGFIKTISEIGLERLDACSKEIGHKFLRSIRPCIGVAANGQPAPCGTCFFVRIEDQPFLVTAAHVIDESNSNPLYVSNNTTLVQIEGNFLITDHPGGRERDPFDFSVLKLSEEQYDLLGSPDLIDERAFCRNMADKSKRGYMALGFPAAMQEVDRPQKTIRSEAWMYVGFCKPDVALLNEMKISGYEHLFVRFEKKVKTFGGEIRNSVKPNGASGGVLIDLGNFDPDKLRPNAPCIGLLAGVLIEHHKKNKAIVATDIQIVADAVRRHLL